MGIEIERKFLVTGTDWRTPDPLRCSQGYLNTSPDRTVRVRIADAQAWLTIKGRTRGASRSEFEYPLPVAEAEQLMELCEQPPVEKLRHRVEYSGRVWEVDEFAGANAGLIVAEIELSSEDESFTKPPWVGREVTEDKRFFNSYLARHPYSQWPEAE